MKKILIIVAAFAAMTFTGCGNSQQQGASDADSTNVEVAAGEVENDEVKTAIEDMTAQLDAKDSKKFNETLAKAQEKIQELVASDPEAAKTYLQQLQEYLKKNADQIKAIAGENAAAAVTAISNAPAAELIETLKSQAGTAKEQGKDIVSAAAKTVEAAKNAPEAVKNAADKAVEAGKAKAEEKAAEKVEEGKKKANEAIDKKVNDLKGKLKLQ